MMRERIGLVKQACRVRLSIRGVDLLDCGFDPATPSVSASRFALQASQDKPLMVLDKVWGSLDTGIFTIYEVFVVNSTVARSAAGGLDSGIDVVQRFGHGLG